MGLADLFMLGSLDNRRKTEQKKKKKVFRFKSNMAPGTKKEQTSN